MAFKLKEAYDISNTKKNVFYSAYLTQPVQFNNVDPNKIQLLEETHADLDEVDALVESPSSKETA
jgi:hypothetical protein